MAIRTLRYSNEWKNKFLPISVTTVTSGDANYAAGVTTSFAQIDTWTDTWRDIRDSALKDPLTGSTFDFPAVNLSFFFEFVGIGAFLRAASLVPYLSTRKFAGLQSFLDSFASAVIKSFDVNSSKSCLVCFNLGL